jgi:hypothetical protein
VTSLGRGLLGAGTTINPGPVTLLSSDALGLVHVRQCIATLHELVAEESISALPGALGIAATGTMPLRMKEPIGSTRFPKHLVAVDADPKL